MTINDYESMIIEQHERLRVKYDMTRADLVIKLIAARRENEAMEKTISKLLEEIRELKGEGTVK